MVRACGPPCGLQHTVCPIQVILIFSAVTSHIPLLATHILKTLSQYRFAAVCSSVAKIEFLKYREFAYAGVVPVGDLPSTFLDCPAGAYVPSRRNFIALTRQIKGIKVARRWPPDIENSFVI